MKDDQVYLNHILVALQKIELYVSKISYEEFLSEDLVLDAVVRELEIIGEASRKVSEGFKGEHLQLPWSKMAGMRNKLIHEYFGVDRKIIWETCQTDLKDLKAIISPLVPAVPIL